MKQTAAAQRKDGRGRGQFIPQVRARPGAIPELKLTTVKAVVGRDPPAPAALRCKNANRILITVAA